MMSLWDALRMNMMISYQELVRTFPSLGAAGLGLAVTALQNTYPVQKYASVIILQPINDSNDVTQPDFVEKTIKANLAIATLIGKALENKPFVEMLKKSDINQIKCSPSDSYTQVAS